MMRKINDKKIKSISGWSFRIFSPAKRIIALPWHILDFYKFCSSGDPRNRMAGRNEFIFTSGNHHSNRWVYVSLGFVNLSVHEIPESFRPWLAFNGDT